MKKCKMCKESKSLDFFAKLKHAIDSYCTPCRTIHMRKWRKKNKERYMFQYKEWYKKAKKRKGFKKRQRNNQLKNAFGITLDEYNTMLETQNGACDICKKPSSRALAVDHCHETDKIRGLLCSNCNIAIGMLQENIERFHSAIDYIKKHKK